MTHVISDEMIEYVSILAKLKPDEQEKEQARKDLAEMLGYIDRLGELDTDGIEPMSHVYPESNRFREDTVTNGDGREQVLANAPEVRDGAFVVPRTFE
ncbi:MAG: Asp-tRNA(Asn)/Glu-tRNA(Gln) amidotransferase subunit GatC [Lachnospiraceae bacterium]|nr:Asp-tRNA(Asn)/Glu-tRNA(Gln) amidotransferase subunit GatC [Lachnospiraceae bacterium]